MNNELISVIIPVYNVKDYLRKCVDSVLNQIYKNIEIILVDDGSTDGSELICDEYAKADERIKVIHKVNGGSTSARNAGIEIASGLYLGFVDSDDWIEPDMYKELYNALVENNADVSIGRMFISNDDNERLDYRSIKTGTYYKKDNIVSHNIFFTDDYKEKGISPNLWDKLFIREKFTAYQKKVDLETRYAEDDLVVYSYLLDASIVTFIDKAIYHYYQRKGSVTKRNDIDYFEKITLFYKQIKQVFEKHPEKDMLLEKLNRYMLDFVVRGVNISFGFGYGNIIPYFHLDESIIKKCIGKRVIIYGAGIVGRDYCSFIRQYSLMDIVMWVDKNYESYVMQGMSVANPEMLNIVKDYDDIIIAVESNEVAKYIINNLVEEYKICLDKIIYKKPKTLIDKTLS